MIITLNLNHQPPLLYPFNTKFESDMKNRLMHDIRGNGYHYPSFIKDVTDTMFWTIPASRLTFQPWDSHPNLKPQILYSSLKFQPQGSNHSLEAQITASRLKSHCWCSLSNLDPQNLLSIGHQPLRGCCPSYHHIYTYTYIWAMCTADHLTLLRLFKVR